MKPLVSIVLLFVAVCFFPILASEREVPFDTYVSRTGSAIVRSEEAGRIESEDAKIIVTVLEVAGCCHDPVQYMRGIRIELIDSRIARTVFLEESDIEPVLRAVTRFDDELGEGHFPVLKPGQQSSCHGAGEFWDPKPPYDIFGVDYCVETGWTGLALRVGSFDHHRFEFPHYRPADLARVLDQALGVLDKSN